MPDEAGTDARTRRAAETATEEGEGRSRRRGRRGRRRRGQDDVILESVDLTETGMVLPELPEDEDAGGGRGRLRAAAGRAGLCRPAARPAVLALPGGAACPAWRRRSARPARRPVADRHQRRGARALLLLRQRRGRRARRGRGRADPAGGGVRPAPLLRRHVPAAAERLRRPLVRGHRRPGPAGTGADPDGYLLPRLQFVPTNFWARTHPDQMARYADGSEGDVSLASPEFWADCVDAAGGADRPLRRPEHAGRGPGHRLSPGAGRVVLRRPERPRPVRAEPRGVPALAAGQVPGALRPARVLVRRRP